MDLRSPVVARAHTGGLGYPSSPPFHPMARFPESPFSDESPAIPNPVYPAVRGLWRSLGLDLDRYGTTSWNPLGALIRPGDTVLVKPNLISEHNLGAPSRWVDVVTHPSVIRAVVDYLLIALAGRGRVVIADGPSTDTDLDLLLDRTGLRAVVGFYHSRSCPVELLDLRQDRWFTRGGITARRAKLAGDPLGYATIEVNGRSAFASYGLSGDFYGADYDREEIRSFHSRGRHAYVLCRTPLEADVIVNVPKLKTHKKTGVTLSLKNMVGINGLRNSLPHYTVGGPADGGDEFPESSTRRAIESKSIRAFKKVLTAAGGTGGAWAIAVKEVGRFVFGDTNRVVRSGNWSGNDTTWRMVLDLNQSLLCFESNGHLRTEARRYLTVVDGVVGGEGNGPLSPDPVPSGVLFAGCNPWAVDLTAARFMGLDPELIPILRAPLADPAAFAWLLPHGDVEVVGPVPAGLWKPYKPHFGWSVLQRSPEQP